MTSNAPQRLFGILMTRNEQDLLRANILFHLRMGCERVIVVDNDSTDHTPRLLRRLARTYPIDWSIERGGIRQPEIVTAMAHEARTKGADWVLPLDTDEFWHPAIPVSKMMDDARAAGALSVSRIEFVQARDVIHNRMVDAVRADRRVEAPLHGNEPVAEFAAGERSMFELAPPRKLMMRTTHDLSVERGAHEANGLAGPIVHAEHMAIFHYAMRSRDAAYSRVEHAGRIDKVDTRPAVSVQNKYWQRMDSLGTLEEAWRAHSHEDGALDVFGRRVELVRDARLAEVLAPYAKSPLRQRLSDLRQRFAVR
jgi:glycosyltransferase involved in cell wall biosynthesis